MAILYLDSSALVKRYLEEKGSGWVVEQTEPSSGNYLYISWVTTAEVLSAIKRKEKGKEIEEGEAAHAIVNFRRELQSLFYIIDVDRNIGSGAMDLIESYALKGFDGVQLATALTVNTRFQVRGGQSLTFVAADKELLTAAGLEGLPVENPNDY